MTPTCDHCKRVYELDAEQMARMDNAKSEGGHAIFVKCPNCDMTTVLQWASPPPKGPPLRCPISTCAGYVVKVRKEGNDFWGCGKCGSQWTKRESLQQEITDIVAKFAYRKKCYRKSGKVWVAADPEKEVEDYEDRVASEPDDPSDSYARD